MGKEIAGKTIIGKFFDSLRSKPEKGIDREAWYGLVMNKLSEANKKDLYPRFLCINGKGDRSSYTIILQNDLIMIFSYLTLHDDSDLDLPGEQAVVLRPDHEPMYAYKVEALKDLGAFWAVSDKGEDLDMIDSVFNDLKNRVEIFDPQKGNLSWKAPAPDINGLTNALADFDNGHH